ncbi:GTPase IMAP family member 6-like [Tachysurus fulvidraco]|uniref:GTPase IMAP family member 6-like n=1 Tax=Tachysurus fulvidraco TaxID=1234273 RepID=UPI000F512331|nr:GTPase IMAP family member 6-like [Tachysurus fulvidraco]
MNQTDEPIADFTVIHKTESMKEEVAGRKVTVVETPDFFSAELSQEKIRKDVQEAINLSKPGPHALILIIPVKLSEDNKVIVEDLKVTFLKMEEIFVERFWKHTMIIFSVSNEPLKMKIEEFIQSGDQEVQTLVQKCEYECDFLMTKDNKVGPQDLEYLLEKIDNREGGNVKDFYSSEVYLKTLASIGGIEKKINNELENLDDPVNELMRNKEQNKEETKRNGKVEQEESEQSPKEGKIVEGLNDNMVIQKVNEECMETERKSEI